MLQTSRSEGWIGVVFVLWQAENDAFDMGLLQMAVWCVHDVYSPGDIVVQASASSISMHAVRRRRREDDGLVEPDVRVVAVAGTAGVPVKRASSGKAQGAAQILKWLWIFPVKSLFWN
jgi:hypothetical protein